MENLLLWIFYILTFYAFLPGLVSRTFGFRVFKRGRAEKEISLTFDDGPDAYYTPLLLDLLKKYNAKATFFVVGVNAERHPDIIKRMHDEGHLIGIHNYVHKSNWLMRPKTVKNQINRTIQIIQSITGSGTVYYRPPWGVVNLIDFAKLGHLQIILWSAMFGDWRKRLGADRLERRMMKKMRPGEVVLLHDCGTTFGADKDAPANMMIALERYMQAAQRKHFRFIRIDEMMRLTDAVRMRQPSLYKRTIVKLWFAWEKCFHSVFGLKTTNEEDPVFYYRVRPYQGEAVALDQGQTLVQGDKVLEIHFDNKKLYEMSKKSRSTMQIAIQMIRSVEKTLPELADLATADPQFADVKALYGVSMLNRGPEKFGFKVLDLPKGFFARSSQLYLKFLLSVIHPRGSARLKENNELLVPKMMIMPFDFLIHRYSSVAKNDAGKAEPFAAPLAAKRAEGFESTPPPFA
ncbi:hypothetical protein PAE9249_01548 [Paenibacillus sp. CECT 9249]|nr:polysaccharide deacetylase family protein [Paenibacillus sp. CECT 9249]CAH0119051.1 hypothetical protein PAE9249_01548 [Paenibacillus sp. CECT 9249]